jgi:SAM-dependent methyltransferase
MPESSNSTSYQGLAYVYDRLMNDAPYDLWVEYALKQWAELGVKPRTVVDLGCGTGTIMEQLAHKGYQMIGIDLSSDMLAVTYDKMLEKGSVFQLFRQDMREFTIPSPVEAVVCFCDSLSYLTSEDDIRKTLQSVHNALNENGVFLFDVHSPYKINEVFGNETFTLTEEDMAYIWQCELLEEDIVEHGLDIFVSQGDVYQRFEEVHEQRGYSADSMIKWLDEAGFGDIECTADFTNHHPEPNSERLFFRAVKK